MNSKFNLLNPDYTGVLKGVILLAYLVLVVLRVPEAIYPGRFWAEEGCVYFKEAFTTDPLRFLTTPNFGYYSLLNKLTCIIATIPPLEYAPLTTSIFALIVQLLPAIMLIYAHIPALPTLPSRVVAVLIILFVQPNQEVWLNTINSQFYLCIATGIILISEPRSRLAHYCRLGLLFIAGLTGVVSCMLLPFFVVEWVQLRKRERLHEMLLLSTMCTIQFLVVISSPIRTCHSFWSILPFALLIKQWTLPFFGSSAADGFSEAIKSHSMYQYGAISACAMIPYIVVLVYLAIYGRREALLLFAGALFVASLSFLKSWDSYNAEQITAHISSFYAGRYYFAPNALLSLALLVYPRTPRLGTQQSIGKLCRVFILVLVALIVATGGRDFFVSKQKHPWFFTGPRWSSEVEQWRKGRAEILQIWPRPWSMNLPQQNNRKLLNKQMQRTDDPPGGSPAVDL